MSINAEKIGKNIQSMTKQYLDRLQRHPWPGNIRELKNVIERSVILEDNQELTEETLPKEFLTSSPNAIKVESNGSKDAGGELSDLKSVEKHHILRVLDGADGNKSEAAKKLDIGLATLYRKLKEYGLD
jgi:transcriptional regulator with PAS, ATPase and Fis domain